MKIEKQTAQLPWKGSNERVVMWRKIALILLTIIFLLSFRCTIEGILP